MGHAQRALASGSEMGSQYPYLDDICISWEDLEGTPIGGGDVAWFAGIEGFEGREDWCGILVIWKGAHRCQDHADER